MNLIKLVFLSILHLIQNNNFVVCLRFKWVFPLVQYIVHSDWLMNAERAQAQDVYFVIFCIYLRCFILVLFQVQINMICQNKIFERAVWLS